MSTRWVEQMEEKIIRKGWRMLSTQSVPPEKKNLAPENHLGDRKSYYGLTTILPSSCSYQQFRTITAPSLECTPEQSAVFARGHFMEDGTSDALVLALDGGKFYREVELSYQDETLDMPIMCHIDFTIPAKLLRHFGVEVPEQYDRVFMECKSSVHGLSDTHLEQVAGQLWLAEEKGHKAIAVIYTVEPGKGSMKLHGPYTHEDMSWAKRDIMKKAYVIQEGLRMNKAPHCFPTAMCCGSCAFRAECPAFPIRIEDDVHYDIQSLANKYATLHAQVATLCAKKEVARNLLVDYIKEDSNFRVGDLLVSLRNHPATPTLSGEKLARSIGLAQQKVEHIKGRLIDAPFEDNFVAVLEELLQSVTDLDGMLQRSLQDAQSEKAGYIKLDVRAARAARQEKVKPEELPKAA